MLTVLPIQSKDEQKMLCEKCNAEFIERAFAYKADDNGFIGICQFTFENDTGYIKHLICPDGITDNEAMIIMLRAAMNFMYRCGLEHSYIDNNGTNDVLLKLSGYKINEEGKYYLNLNKFYNTPCNNRD